MINIIKNLPVVLIDESGRKKEPRRKIRKSFIDNGVELILGENESNSVTYIMPVTSTARAHMEALKRQYEEYLEPFNLYVDKLVNRQLELLKRKNDNTLIKLENEDMEKLNSLISDDGEFGINKTAGRIFEFAKAISGEDKSKIDQIKEAINKEFSTAESVIGEVTEISHKTHCEVMKRLDKWSNEK
jgi:gas vesicle protein